MRACAARPAIFGAIFEHDVQHMSDPLRSLRFRWIIQGDWKLIVPHSGREPEARPELYNITGDPNEKLDLADREPDRRATLAAELDAWWK